MKRVIVLSLVLLLIFTACQNAVPQFEDTIIKFMDNAKYNKGGICKIDVNKMVKFKWDRMVIYKIGTTKEEIINKLGISNDQIEKQMGMDFVESVDLSEGVIFVCDDKIVYKDILFPDFENLGKIHYWVESDNISCLDYTPTTVDLNGKKEEVNKKICYFVIAMPKN